MTKRTFQQPSNKAPAQDLPADAHGDFYFDELMTPQPDATREYFRARIEQPKTGPKETD